MKFLIQKYQAIALSFLVSDKRVGEGVFFIAGKALTCRLLPGMLTNLRKERVSVKMLMNSCEVDFIKQRHALFEDFRTADDEKLLARWYHNKNVF